MKNKVFLSISFLMAFFISSILFFYAYQAFLIMLTASINRASLYLGLIVESIIPITGMILLFYVSHTLDRKKKNKLLFISVIVLGILEVISLGFYFLFFYINYGQLFLTLDISSLYPFDLMVLDICFMLITGFLYIVYKSEKKKGFLDEITIKTPFNYLKIVFPFALTISSLCFGLGFMSYIYDCQVFNNNIYLLSKTYMCIVCLFGSLFAPFIALLIIYLSIHFPTKKLSKILLIILDCLLFLFILGDFMIIFSFGIGYLPTYIPHLFILSSWLKFPFELYIFILLISVVEALLISYTIIVFKKEKQDVRKN